MLVYQYGGATTAPSGADAGKIVDIGTAGQYETSTVRSLSGDTIFYSPALGKVYDPVYTQLVVDAGAEDRRVNDLTADFFNGATGGVIFLTAEKSLTISGTLDAGGRGLRGGKGVIKPGDCNFLSPADGYTYPIGDFQGTWRGEGVSPVVTGRELGRAPSANGGGGGNDHNSGGGGGSNIARGGSGGKNITTSPFRCRGQYPGIGAYGLDADPDRVFLGGGGGAGHANNTDKAAGGNGGGLIVLSAPSIHFESGSEILLAGAAGASVNGDGAGGGGGGGTLLLLGDDITGSLNADLQGGSGGDTNNQDDRCFGPGGGGSGGRLLIAGDYGTLTLNANFEGGSAGIRTGSAICGPTDGAAEPGQEGNLQTITFSRPASAFTLSSDSACPGESIRVNDNSTGADEVSWKLLPDTAGLKVTRDEEGLSIVLTGEAKGSYFLTQTLAANGRGYPGDTLSFKVHDVATADSVSAQMDGNYVTVTVAEAEGYAQISYDFGDGTVVSTEATSLGHRYESPGSYPISVTLANRYCGNLIIEGPTVDSREPSRALILEKDPTGCPPLTITPFDLSQGSYDSRRWDFPGGESANSADEKPSITYTKPGTYTLTLTLQGNTVGGDTTATLEVIVFEAPTADFDYSIDNGQVSFTNRSTGSVESNWSFGDGATSEAENPVHTYTKDSTYAVTLITTGSSCTDTLRQEITINATTATHDLTSVGVTIFPNPTTGLVRIGGPASVISAYDARGRKIAAENSSVDLTNEPPGIYLLQLRVAGKTYLVRVVRQ